MCIERIVIKGDREGFFRVWGGKLEGVLFWKLT